MRYGVAIGWSAFLLFLVQPLLAQAILPWFGGSPALWTTALLFFQCLLLGGYAYAHLLVTRLPHRAGIALHLGLLAAAVVSLGLRGAGGPALLSIAPDPGWRPGGGEDPLPRVLGVLAGAAGLPYLLLSASAPLLQGWYARERARALPYRLYALSNLGSLLALLGYPLLVQPHLDLPRQAAAWAWGFALFVLACATCAAGAWRAAPPPAPAERGPTPAPARGDVALWVALPACASALLLATTNRLCQDVASVPFLWVLPLALYLLSFVLTFEWERAYARRLWLPLLALAAAATVWAIGRGVLLALAVQVLVGAGTLLVAAVACHGELVRRKPGPERLTGFYLAVALGGALGGAGVALAAPRLFATFLELPAALLATLLGVGLAVWRDPAGPVPRLAPRRRTLLALGLLLVLAGLGEALRRDELRRRAHAVEITRNFFGVLRLERYEAGPRAAALLYHGSVLHGAQLLAPGQRGLPTSYYGHDSGVGRLLRQRAAERPRLRVGLVGLGAGTLATYGRAGDVLRFYEIDPAVARMARERFTFLGDSPASVEVVLGDARLSLEREAPQAFDVLVVDAFTSDAIPVHLLTEEAFACYRRHLAPDGVLALHLTNRSLDLAPLVEALAARVGLEVALASSPADPHHLIQASRWALVTGDRALLQAPLVRAAAVPSGGRRVRPWTDAHSDLLAVLR